MASSTGLFYSASDADSEGIEGAYFVWSMDELNSIVELDKANPLLEFFPYSTHEPYYPKYIREDLANVARQSGLELFYSKNAYLSKSLAFKKI